MQYRKLTIVLISQYGFGIFILTLLGSIVSMMYFNREK